MPLRALSSNPGSFFKIEHGVEVIWTPEGGGGGGGVRPKSIMHPGHRRLCAAHGHPPPLSCSHNTPEKSFLSSSRPQYSVLE